MIATYVIGPVHKTVHSHHYQGLEHSQLKEVSTAALDDTEIFHVILTVAQERFHNITGTFMYSL